MLSLRWSEMFIEPFEQNEFELRQERDIALLSELISLFDFVSINISSLTGLRTRRYRRPF
jgi:hypothetical protein